MRLALCVALLAPLISATPRLNRVSPLGGQSGTTVTVELTGVKLEGAASVTFDTPGLQWLETLEAKDTLLRGKVRIAPDAALGPHFIRVAGAHGPSNTRLFNVTQFPGLAEVEPNNTQAAAQPITLQPQVLHGSLDTHADTDYFSFSAHAGQRWLFDLQSIERGGFLECSLTLYDEAGREIAFNEDQDEYLETPRLEVTFPRDGRYTVKVDQYRGPQGVDCDKNCGYMLQISHLPVIVAASPLGGITGSKLTVDIYGRALGRVQQVYLSPIRNAEYYRLTFPFSTPIQIPSAPRINGRLLQTTADRLQARFLIPVGTPPGLWRIWTVSPDGIAEGINLEISRNTPGETIHNGSLDHQNQERAYPVELTAGVPFHAWTLAAQLGLPAIDTVLELFDSTGKLLAEHDDLMTGQGTVIGNPDSSLYFTPKTTGPARLLVRDRTGRAGPSFAYRLHIAAQAPGFQLLTEPEEFTLAPGAESELEALLIREPGFNQAVDVWVEGLPPGVTASKGRFRADQEFGPSGDGDNINIPIAQLKIHAPAALAAGAYPIRVLGRAASGGPIVEGFTTLWIGPTGKRNDTRRPLPRILLNVAP